MTRREETPPRNRSARGCAGQPFVKRAIVLWSWQVPRLEHRTSAQWTAEQRCEDAEVIEATEHRENTDRSDDEPGCRRFREAPYDHARADDDAQPSPRRAGHPSSESHAASPSFSSSLRR